jgi:hypothetical protein
MTRPPVPIGTVIRAQEQRTMHDCTVAALANLLGIQYELALSAFAQVRPNTILQGSYTTTIKAAADLLYVKLRTKRTFDWDEDTGVLVALCKASNINGRHAVVLSAGRVIDDGEVWQADVWRATRKATRCTLLVVVP